MHSELVPHVTKNDSLLGLVERSTAYKQGLIHRSIHGLIKNEQGLYLLQQRSSTKSAWPDKIDLSLGETVKPDESYEDALRRGLSEELGVEAKSVEVLRDRYYQEYFWDEYKVFCIVCLFLVTTDQEITLTDGEVSNIWWRTKDEIGNLISSDPTTCTPWLVADWQYLLEQNKL